MKVLTIQLGINRIPNLALLKIAACHKKIGDEVSVDEPEPDKVYVSSPFQIYNIGTDYSKIFPDAEIEYGGYGFNNRVLPPYIEHIRPDYSYAKELAKTVSDKDTIKEYYQGDYSIGYTTRGCIRHCVKPPCIVRGIEGRFRRHAHISEFHHPDHKKIMLMDNNILADKEWFKETAKYIIENNLKVMEHGFDIRLMDDEIAEILSHIIFYKGLIHFAFDSIDTLQDFSVNIEKVLKFKKGRYIVVYCYEKDNLQDLIARTEFIRKFGCLPFVMPDPEADQQIIKYARYINNPRIKYVCSWEEYQKKGWLKKYCQHKNHKGEKQRKQNGKTLLYQL